MDRSKVLVSLLNNSSDQNWERENLFIEKRDKTYYLKITSEAKGAGVNRENQPLQRLYSNNPIRLDEKNLDESIKDWINKVNASRLEIGYRFLFDTEEVIIKSRVFVENIFNELAKKTLLDTVTISEYSFDTMVWSVTEFLCCDFYDDREVYLSIRMNHEIDSDNDGPILKRYGKIPEGLTDEEIECEDFEYILPDKINGVNIWYDGFILWSEELVFSNVTQILPLKITKNTTIDCINEWLKGNKVHHSYLSNEEITQEEYKKIKNFINVK